MTKPDSVYDALKRFFERSKRPILFAGAGVSARAGLPLWDDYLGQLAEQTRPADPLTRHQMMERIHERQYTLAAEYFFLSPGMTDGAKNNALILPLATYDISKLSAVAPLPFSAYVTTNFDRVLIDLYASHHGKAAVEVNLGDPTLTAAPYQDAFYVARLHGRVEVPATMVLSRSQYDRLGRDASYVDFLRHLFCTRPLLFLGFSFLDPAIQAVLRAIRERVGPVHAGHHLALVDSGADADFLTELRHHNIEIVRYNGQNDHGALWDGVARFSEPMREIAVPVGDAASDVFAYARKYFAASLARRRLGAHLRPLKQAVAEGMVLELLRRAGTTGLSREELGQRISEQLHLETTAAQTLIERSLEGLAADSLYETGSTGRLQAKQVKGDLGELKHSLAVLVEGAVQRLVVRERGTDTPEIRTVLASYFEYLVLRRGWDMGAAYAARRPPQAIVVEELLKRLLALQGTEFPPPPQLVRAVEGVLLSPSDAEASILSELGRLAFALELVRQAPQDTLFSTHVMPSRIYLDANILMPAIVEGHPYNSLYAAAMQKLITAASASSFSVDVCAYFGFLNEVVSHRKLAVQNIESHGSRAAEFIEREVRLYGAVDMNVFVAGFARTLMRGERLSFAEYLQKFAPYRSELELAGWLARRGIRVVDQKSMSARGAEYPTLLHHFEKEFAQEVATRMRTATLVAHDALQIAALLGDWRRGERTVLVTADRRMRDAVACGPFPNVGSAMLSGVGFVQMIELLVGALTDERSMAQLLWSTRASSVAEKVRKYFIDLALTQYDAALAMNMESVVRELTEDITFKMERDAEEYGQTDADESRLSLGKYLEAFEPRFYELMRAAQEKLQKDGQ